MHNQKKVWNSLAKSWSDFRNRPVDEAVNFAQKIKKKEGRLFILDIGCGNARNLLPFAGHDLYGVDFSKKMIAEARKLCKKNSLTVKFKVCDARKLPFKKNSFDVVLMLAVLHHFSINDQKKVLSQARRVMKPRATLLCTVWYKKESGEHMIGWKKKNHVLTRYYYFFKKKELKELFESSGFSLKSIKIAKRSNEKNIVVKALKKR